MRGITVYNVDLLAMLRRSATHAWGYRGFATVRGKVLMVVQDKERFALPATLASTA